MSEPLLAGLRVLDMTRFLAGPYGAMMLGDMGADVIKVESLDGDSTRTLAPHFFNGDSAYFLSINRNKRSIALDLRTAEGAEVLARLIGWCDVVIDNLRAPQRAQLGLDYDAIERINPRAISCSVTGFGSSGPYADRPAYDIIVQALSGVMSLTGEADGAAVRAGVPIGDLVAGLNAVIAVLAALHERQRSGRGQHLDIALLDGQVSMLSYLAAYFLVSGAVPGRQGRSHDSIPTYDTFVAGDGVEVVVAANTEEMWRGLCAAIERLELVDDERFTTNARRLANREALTALLRDAFRAGSGAQLLARLDAHGVPAAPINTLDRVVTDPQVAHRAMVCSVAHRDGGVFRVVGNPIKASRSTDAGMHSPPGLGQHGVQLLGELGFDDVDITRLVGSGHVGAGSAADHG